MTANSYSQRNSIVLIVNEDTQFNWTNSNEAFCKLIQFVSNNIIYGNLGPLIKRFTQFYYPLKFARNVRLLFNAKDL